VRFGVLRRYRSPIVVASVILLLLCATLAVSLYQQQREISELFNESIGFHKQAALLEGSLKDLHALKGQIENPSALHQRILDNIAVVREKADRPEQQELIDALAVSFDEYRVGWDRTPPLSDPGHAEAVKSALADLDQTLVRCQELQQHPVQEIEKAASDHTLVLRELALGMVAVGLFGGLAGVGLGYVAAGRWQRTMHKLQVHIRRAAGKLGAAVPEIVVSGKGACRRSTTRCAAWRGASKKSSSGFSSAKSRSCVPSNSRRSGNWPRGWRTKSGTPSHRSNSWSRQARKTRRRRG